MTPGGTKADDQLTATITTVGDTTVITLVGELDSHVEPALQMTIADALARADAVTIRLDATALRFIDSAGIRCLILAKQAAETRGYTFVLDTARDGLAARVVEVCGLTDWFAAQ